MILNSYSEPYKAYVYGVCDENGKTEYPTLADLAKQYGIGLSTLSHKAAEEKWQQQRQDAEARITAEAFAKYEGELAAYLAETDRLASKISTAMLRHIDKRFMQAENDKERDALVVKYGDLAGKLARNVHTAYGVDLQVAEMHAEEVEVSNEAA